jgi:hypothetical protein
MQSQWVQIAICYLSANSKMSLCSEHELGRLFLLLKTPEGRSTLRLASGNWFHRFALSSFLFSLRSSDILTTKCKQLPTVKKTAMIDAILPTKTGRFSAVPVRW